MIVKYLTLPLAWELRSGRFELHLPAFPLSTPSQLKIAVCARFKKIGRPTSTSSLFFSSFSSFYTQTDEIDELMRGECVKFISHSSSHQKQSSKLASFLLGFHRGFFYIPPILFCPSEPPNYLLTDTSHLQPTPCTIHLLLRLSSDSQLDSALPRTTLLPPSTPMSQ